MRTERQDIQIINISRRYITLEMFVTTYKYGSAKIYSIGYKSNEDTRQKNSYNPYNSGYLNMHHLPNHLNECIILLYSKIFLTNTV